MKIWPKYFSDLLVKGDPRSSIGVITLWTSKELIFNSLKSFQSEVSLVGQLYSKEGINWVLRNIFLNPRVTKIILCGQDKSGSGEALLKFVKNGIDNDGFVIGAENAKIHKEIDRNYLEKFRQKVEIIDARNKNPTDLIIKEIKRSKKISKPWIEPKEFAEPERRSPETMPSEKCDFKIQAEKVGDAWLEILDAIMKFGHVKKSQHSSDQREVVNLIATITGEDIKNIDWKPYFRFSKKDFENYLPQVVTKNKIPNIEYTYGQRLRDHDGIDQIQSIVEDLKRTPYSRRAVAVTWKVAADHNNPHAPCLDLIQCLVQDNKLFFTAFIRSNDMFRAWPMNALAFLRLQKIIADGCGFEMGPFTTISGSAHIYSDCWNDAIKIVKKYAKGPMCKFDPRGNYVINVSKGKILAKHLSPLGDVLEEFSGSTAREVFDVISMMHGVSFIEHAFDLGAELQKAEIALKQKINYVQDRPLNFPV